MSFEPASAAGLRRELEQANTNLNFHLKEKQTHENEATRWQAIVTQIEATIDLLEKPASAVAGIQKLPPVSRGAPGKPRVRWSKAWPLVLGGLKAKNVTPTKRELMVEVQARYKKSEAYSNHIVNGAISSGDLVLRHDRCYLPGQEPTVTVDRRARRVEPVEIHMPMWTTC
jgi:hypothetical protein